MEDLKWFPMMSALLANLLAQVSKVIFYRIKTGKWDWHWVLMSGGFPSSHSSTVTALTLCIGLQTGFSGNLFAITSIFSLIVMYDACHVRYYCGKGIEMTLALVRDLEEAGIIEVGSPEYHQKMKTILGHKVSEVLGGVIVGLITPFIILALRVLLGV